MIFIGFNVRSRNAVSYEIQTLRGKWYHFMARTHLLGRWNNLKRQDPKWQIAEVCVDFWGHIYGGWGEFCYLPKKD